MSAYEFMAVEPTVIAVIPAYNEARFIGSVVLSAKRMVEVVIVVDDGSTDYTSEIAAAAGAEVVRLAQNQGKGAALNAGFRAALKHHPDAVVMLDGDAQHDPEEIPSVINPVLAGKADVVIGSRFLTTKSDIPWWRQIGQHVLTGVTNVASGVKLTDSQSGFRAFSPRAVEQMAFHSGGLAVESEMQFQIQNSHLKWMEVPIGVSYRDGNKRNPVAHGIHVIDSILGMIAQRHPLLFFGVPGLLGMATGIGFGMWVANHVTTYHSLSVGGALVSLVFLLTGLLLCVTAVILHSVDRMTGRLREDVRITLERANRPGTPGGGRE